jgi:hypothetical protein
MPSPIEVFHVGTGRRSAQIAADDPHSGGCRLGETFHFGHLNRLIPYRVCSRVVQRLNAG